MKDKNNKNDNKIAVEKSLLENLFETSKKNLMMLRKKENNREEEIADSNKVNIFNSVPELGITSQKMNYYSEELYKIIDKFNETNKFNSNDLFFLAELKKKIDEWDKYVESMKLFTTVLSCRVENIKYTYSAIMESIDSRKDKKDNKDKYYSQSDLDIILKNAELYVKNLENKTEGPTLVEPKIKSDEIEQILDRKFEKLEEILTKNIKKDESETNKDELIETLRQYIYYLLNNNDKILENNKELIKKYNSLKEKLSQTSELNGNSDKYYEYKLGVANNEICLLKNKLKSYESFIRQTDNKEILDYIRKYGEEVTKNELLNLKIDKLIETNNLLVNKYKDMEAKIEAYAYKELNKDKDKNKFYNFIEFSSLLKELNLNKHNLSRDILKEIENELFISEINNNESKEVEVNQYKEEDGTKDIKTEDTIVEDFKEINEINVDFAENGTNESDTEESLDKNTNKEVENSEEEPAREKYSTEKLLKLAEVMSPDSFKELVLDKNTEENDVNNEELSNTTDVEVKSEEKLEENEVEEDVESIEEDIESIEEDVKSDTSLDLDENNEKEEEDIDEIIDLDSDEVLNMAENIDENFDSDEIIDVEIDDELNLDENDDVVEEIKQDDSEQKDIEQNNYEEDKPLDNSELIKSSIIEVNPEDTEEFKEEDEVKSSITENKDKYDIKSDIISDKEINIEDAEEEKVLEESKDDNDEEETNTKGKLDESEESKIEETEEESEIEEENKETKDETEELLVEKEDLDEEDLDEIDKFLENEDNTSEETMIDLDNFELDVEDLDLDNLEI